MKRFLALSIATIGLFSVGVAPAKDHEIAAIVSVDEPIGSVGLVYFIHSNADYSYVAEVTNEFILPYVDELVKPTLKAHKDEVFHPPVNGSNLI